jgi:hypothetical protein
MIRILPLVTLSSIVLSAQSVPARPTFESQPASQIYKGPAAEPKLNNDQRVFRAVIRRDAKSAVQFAGHYTVPLFGCGAGCSEFYIVDSVTGRVYDGFGVVELPGSWLEKQVGNPPDRVQFTPSSRLLKINGCPNEKDCGYYDYVMQDGKGLKLIQKWLLPKEFQY